MTEATSTDEYDREAARQALYESYGGSTTEEATALDGLTEIHDGASSFLALLDQATDDEGDLPDDLSAETKRQISTAETSLRRALDGIEETAQKRLNDDSGGEQGGKSDGLTECPNCDGQGIIDVEGVEDVSDCPECHGNGLERT